MDHAALAKRVKEVALLEGDFTLRSGKKSKFYFDKYLFETQPDVLEAMGREIAARLPPGTQRIAGPELGAVALAAAFVGAVLAVALIYSDRLPTLIGPIYMTGLVSSGVGPFASAVLATSTIFAFCQRNRGRIDDSIAVSLLALTLDMTLLYIGVHRFTLAFYAGRALTLARREMGRRPTPAARRTRSVRARPWGRQRRHAAGLGHH